MNKITWLSFCFLGCLFFQANAQGTLTANLTECEQAPVVYTFNGIAFEPVGPMKPGKKEEYEWEFSTDQPDFFYLKAEDRRMLPIILGGEAVVNIEGTCPRISSADIHSELNEDYKTLKAELDKHRDEGNALQRQFMRADEVTRDSLQALLTKVDAAKLNLLDSIRETNDYLAQIAAVNTYLSYINNKGEYRHEILYFANEFFGQADLADPAYNHMPWLYESFRSFTNTLLATRLAGDPLQQTLERNLSKVPEKTVAHRMALGGVVSVLREKRHDLYADFGKQFLDLYGEELPRAMADMGPEIDRMLGLRIGGIVPDFTQQTPDGKDLSLISLRGDYVLIDFWASWCRPCRMENPNVLRAYNKYKDKGFEILGVSLDKTEDKWVEAIEEDGLTWLHVSDLQGWKNEVAQQFGISSIPATILIDPEGKIIAKNLRGPYLESKLEELFGPE